MSKLIPGLEPAVSPAYVQSGDLLVIWRAGGNYSSYANIGNVADGLVQLDSSGDLPTIPIGSGILDDPTNSNTPTASQTVINNIYDAIPEQSATTWTPIDLSGASISFTTTNPDYIRTGKQITLSATIQYASNSNSSNTLIGGFVGMPVGNYIGTVISTSAANIAASITSAGIALVNATTGAAIINSALSTQTIKLTITYQSST